MIDQYPPSNGVLTSLIWRKTAVGGETSLSGYDDASQALSYTPGQEQVYLNGILLVRGQDYTATNGTSITGLAALAANDFVQINCYNNFSVASVPATSITGEVTNSQISSLATSKLTGTIANNQLANSSITINGSAVSLGGSTTIAGGSAQDSEPTSPTEGQLWLDTNGTLATTAFTEKATLTTTGDIYYASAANTPARRGIGSTGQVLTVSGGVPVWATPAGGKVLQVVQATYGTETTIATTTWTDSGLSATITPSATSSRILVMVATPFGTFAGGSTGEIGAGWRLLRGSTFIFGDKAASGAYEYGHYLYATSASNFSFVGMLSASYVDSPSTTLATTYKIQGSALAGKSCRFFHGNNTGSLILMEIGA